VARLATKSLRAVQRDFQQLTKEIGGSPQALPGWKGRRLVSWLLLRSLQQGGQARAGKGCKHKRAWVHEPQLRPWSARGLGCERLPCPCPATKEQPWHVKSSLEVSAGLGQHRTRGQPPAPRLQGAALPGWSGWAHSQAGEVGEGL